MVGGKPEPEFLLDPVKFRVGEPGVDRTDGSEPQPPHRFLTETTAILALSVLIKYCHHDARLYLVNGSRICAFLIAPTHSRRPKSEHRRDQPAAVSTCARKRGRPGIGAYRGVPTYEELTELSHLPDPSTLLFSPRSGAPTEGEPGRREAVEHWSFLAGRDLTCSRARIAERRGGNIAIVAVARKLLTLVYYGLRDGHIRALRPAQVAA